MPGLPTDLFQQPWAMEPSRLSQLVAQLARPEAERAAAFQGAENPSRPVRLGPVSVIPIIGMLSHRPGLESLFGLGTSVEEIRQIIRAELADPTIRAVILDIDSPGGTVAGVPELAHEIFAMRGAKPIVAVANTTAASAAYWLAAQADEVIVTPSGSVGSVGVYAVHREASRAMEQEGITTTVIGIPDAKTDANEWVPLTPEAKANILDRATTFYGQFVGDVARGRGVSSQIVEDKYGQGRMLMAGPAKNAGMVDGIATLDQTIARVYRNVGGQATTRRQLHAEMGLPELVAGETATQYVVGDRGTELIIHEPDGSLAEAGISRAYTLENITITGDRPTVTGDAPATVPFADRVAALVSGADAMAAEAHELLSHTQERARLRAKEGRPLLSNSTESALRAIHSAAETILALADPEPAVPVTPPAADPPVAVAPVQPMQPFTVPAPRRFQTDEDWARYIAQESWR